MGDDAVKVISPSDVLRMKEWKYLTKVEITARVAGIGKNVKNVPQKIQVVNGRDEVVSEVDLSQPANAIYLRNYIFRRRALEALLKEEAELRGEVKPIMVKYSAERMNLIPLLLRDIYPVKSGDKFMYYDFVTYLVNCPVPGFSKGSFKGFLVDDGHDNVTALIYFFEPLQEDFEIYSPTAEDLAAFEKYFRGSPDLKRSIGRTLQPFIVGRDFEKYIAALALHSPLWLNFKGDVIRGALHVLFLGDSTTGKSKILNWIAENVGGEFGVGESGRRTGFLFTVDAERSIIVWGLLVHADRTLALIDGLQRLSPEEMGEFREALRTKRVVVRMKVSGEAPARCRIIAAANPNRPLDEYVNHCEAVRDTKCFMDPVDITRWDFIVRFWAHDVSSEDIAKVSNPVPEIPVEVFRKHVLWAWKLKPEDISFTDEAVRRIEEAFVALSEEMLPEIPMINKGFQEVLARVAASVAVLKHNVDGKGRVVVDVPHVNEAIDLLVESLRRWEYFEYVKQARALTDLAPDELQEISTAIDSDPTVARVLEAIADNEGITLTALQAKVGVERGEVLRAVGALKAYNLLEHASRGGYYLSKRGVKLVRWRRAAAAAAAEGGQDQE